MADEKDTPELDLEPRGDAPAKDAAGTPEPDKKPPAEPSADDDPLAAKQGETVEQYAARVRSEINWRDKQIGRNHRQKKEADERLARLAELEAENNQLKELAQAGRKPKADAEPAPKPAPPQKPATPAVDPMAEARFQVGVERLSEQLNSQKDWKQASKNLEAAGGVPRDVVAAILDTDDPAHVMTQLGMNMERFQQIMDMSEGRRRAALIKMGMEATGAPAPEPKPEAKKPSAAPAPRVDTPSGVAALAPGEGLVPDRDDRAPIPPPGEYPKDRFRGEEHDAAWYAARARQKREALNRPWSVGGKGGGR